MWLTGSIGARYCLIGLSIDIVRPRSDTALKYVDLKAFLWLFL